MICKVCGSDKYSRLDPKYCQVPNNLCENCGLLYIPDEARIEEAYYKNNGYFQKRSILGKFVTPPYRLHMAKRRLTGMLSIAPTMNLKDADILEIGCAYGELIAYIKKEYGARVYGVEPSKEAAKGGADSYGIDIFPGLLEEYKPKCKFHVILCIHTLEHVDKPRSFLEIIYNFLADDGILYLEVPNIMKPTNGISYKDFLYHEHLQTFSACNLSKLLNSIGFNVIAYSDTGHLQFFVKKEVRSEVKIPNLYSIDILNFIKSYERKNYIPSKVAPYYNFCGNLLDLLLFSIREKHT